MTQFVVPGVCGGVPVFVYLFMWCTCASLPGVCGGVDVHLVQFTIVCLYLLCTDVVCTL